MPANGRAPSFQFYPRDYMADPDVQALSWEQRGRYHWSLCCSAITETPGVAPESDWARWMGYEAGEWVAVRDLHARCFDTSREGVWVQQRMSDDRKAQERRYQQARKGARATNRARWG